MVLYLKENRRIALQVACGNVLDTKIIDGNLVVNTNEQYLFDTIMEKDNLLIIKKALEWQNFSGQLIINKIKTKKDLQKEDLEKLEKLGLNVKIIEGD